MMTYLMTPKGRLVLRQAIPEDAAQLRTLRLEALADTPQAFASDVESAASESVESWARRIADNSGEQGIVCVAEADGGLTAMLGCRRGDRAKTRHGGMVWGVYVQPVWRGLHIAEALLGLTFAWAQANGLTVQKLGVVASNTPAIRCYARCGFSVYGVEPQAIYYNGVYYDELLMARPVALSDRM